MSKPHISQPVIGAYCVDIPEPGGGGIVRIKADDRQHAEQIQTALMAAWKRGFAAAQKDIRDALGVQSN